jgi:hypothetical protein
MYTNGIDHPEFTCWPPYQSPEELATFLAQASEEELDWIRAQYHGKVTMVDHWLGRLLDRMDAQDMWKDTCLIVTTDHGHDLCYDRAARVAYGKQYPHPESHARIPLIVCHPDATGERRVDALSCAVDVSATVRELIGDPAPDGPHGRSLLPLVLGHTASHREHVLYGTFGAGATITTPEWTLAQGSIADAPLFWYSTTALRVSSDMQAGKFIPGVDIPQWRVPARACDLPSYLWHRNGFALVRENLLPQHDDVARQLRGMLRDAVLAVPCPPETLVRLGLASSP